MKKNYLFKLLLLLFAITWLVPSFAQIKREGTPPSFATANRSVQTVREVKSLQAPDIISLKVEDEVRAKYGLMPRISKILPANYTIENAGEWISLETGEKIWQLRLKSPGAIALSLYYDRFYLPEGSKLFIYSANKKHVVGAFTAADNPKFGPEFSTEMVAGDELILEYVAPATVDKASLLSLEDKNGALVAFADNTHVAPQFATRAGVAKALPRGGAQPVISISGVGYVYNNAIIGVAKEFDEPTAPGGDEGRSSACMININCPEGEAWQDQKKGVAATVQVIAGSGYICSGTILNNTARDMTPYFLMAYHCGEVNGKESTVAELNQWQFYFHFERIGCENSSSSAAYRTATGAQRLVATNINGGSDGLLLRLNTDIPPDWDIYFNGWNRTNTALTSGAGIHHPAGDYKKISFITSPATQATWNSEDATGATNAHWRVTYGTVNGKRGVTEGGSSGSPLFDQDGLVVGSLSGGTGGDNPCANTSMYSLFGKLWWHWDQSPDPNQHMSKYLDPLGTGVTTLEGMYSATDPDAKFIASDTVIYVTQYVEYKDVSALAATWEWSFEGGTPASHIGRIPPAIQYNTVGTFTTTLTINKGTESELSVTKTITVSMKEAVCSDNITISDGTTTAQFPLGISQRQAFSAAIYTADEIGLNNGGVITKIAWNTGNATTKTRTLYVYLKEVDETTFTAQNWSAEIAGATLVYQSASTEANAKGWNTLTLATPFTYTGTKNLKVLVRSYATNTSGYYNSNCAYTTVTDAHQQWTATNTSIPTTNGTVNANRPNIRFTVGTPCGAVTPVANFIIDGAKNIHWKEGFDGTTFPPSGWALEKPGASTNTWISVSKDTLVAKSLPPFSTIDTSDVNSAFISWDASNTVDARLISSPVDIPDSALLDFYIYYGGAYIYPGVVTLSVSVDDGATWQQEWSNPYQSSSAWRKITTDLSKYAGQSVKFAWRYEGLDMDVVMLDGISVYTPNNTIEIFEGESVSFIDRSAGPPLSWQWVFPGATPAVSTATNPSAAYAKAGTYDVSLTVASSLGTHTKTVTGAVIVKKIPLEVIWKSTSDGYTVYPHSGQFLPAGGTVQLRDVTTGEPPTSWAWELPGATPASATGKTVQALYPEGANTYSVKLKVANALEEKEKEITNYIQIGDTAEIWNVAGGEIPFYRYANASGYSATGADLFTQTSERFSALKPGLVSSVKVYISAGSVALAIIFPITVALYADDNGLPGTRLSPVMNVTSIVQGYNLITFPTPVGVPEAFHVVVGSTNYNYVYFTVPCVENRTDEYSTVKAYYNDSWSDLGDLVGVYTSMNIVPEFTYTEFELISTADTIKKKNIDPTPETITFKTTAPSWTATADPWITLSETSGTTTDVTLTFTVTENKTPEFREGVITINSAAQAVITVLQGGGAPSSLTAVYNDANKSVKLAWEEAKDPFFGIFDDIEGHTSLTVNSPGTVGWSYIDGDMDNVYDFFQGAVTGKMAFIALELDPIFTHSGVKALVCPTNETDANDDWLISPALDFATSYSVPSFTFSFWAMSAVADYGLERIRVAYSTTGNAKGDFTNVLTTGSYVEVPDVWTKYSFTVPATAKYVAINSVSDYTSILFIDDIAIGIGTAPASAQANQTLSANAGATAKPAFTKEKAAVEQSAKTNIKLEARKVQNPVVSSLKEDMQLQSLASGDETVIRWDDGVVGHYINAGAGAQLEVAAKFDPSDLKDYKNAFVKGVEIAIYALGDNMVLNIRQNGAIVHSQPLTGLTPEAFNYIELTEPVPIDVKQDLMVSYAFTQVGDPVCTTDNGPAVAGKGDLTSLNGGSFVRLSTLGTGLDYNWNIAVTLVGGKSLVSYNVYRDGTLIAENIEDKEYEDTNPPQAQNVCYTVTAIYEEDPFFESTESNQACLYSKGHLTIAANDATRREAGFNPAFTAYIKEGTLLAGDTEGDILALVKFDTRANSLSPAGTYAIIPVFTDLAASTYVDNYVFISAAGNLIVTAIPTIITQQPVGANICEGGQHTFSVAATGLDVKYQLQKEVNGAWTNVGAEKINSGTATSFEYT
ncbi:MAG: choice-of-anchor J domain-containing protein, partial [Prevotellaceae bacterium]|nr:choice-of-anchor J domain-containing protein [Prevotellaceae bacterium]